MLNYSDILKQYTDTYLDISHCNELLRTKWPLLHSLLPVDWWYPESPIRQWLNYSEEPTYEIALNLLQEELSVIFERFPTSYNKWIGSFGVPQQFWSKRFESMVIYLLIRAGLNVRAIDVKSDTSDNEVDIMVSDDSETVYVECTSARKPTSEADLQTIQLHAQDYLNYRFHQIPGSYYISCNVLPDLTNKQTVDNFVNKFSDFIHEYRPVKQVKWRQIEGFPTERMMPGQHAATITPTSGLIRTQVGGFPQPFVDTSGQALRNKIRRKLKQSRQFSGQRVLMIDASFRPDMLFENVLGFKDDIRSAAMSDRTRTFSFITLCQMAIQTEHRLFMGRAYSMPWATKPTTSLISNILFSTNMGTEATPVR